MALALKDNPHLLRNEQTFRLDRFLFLRWWMARYCQPTGISRAKREPLLGEEYQILRTFMQNTADAPFVPDPLVPEATLATWSIWRLNTAVMLNWRGAVTHAALHAGTIASDMTLFTQKGNWRIRTTGIPVDFWLPPRAKYIAHDRRLHMPWFVRREMGLPRREEPPLQFLPPADRNTPNFVYGVME